MEVFFSSHVSLFSTAFQLYFSGSQDGDTSELWSCGPTKITRVRKWYHSWYVTSYSTVLYVLCVTLGKLACSESKAIQWHTFNSISASLAFWIFTTTSRRSWLLVFFAESARKADLSHAYTLPVGAAKAVAQRKNERERKIGHRRVDEAGQVTYKKVHQ